MCDQISVGEALSETISLTAVITDNSKGAASGAQYHLPRIIVSIAQRGGTKNLNSLHRKTAAIDVLNAIVIFIGACAATAGKGG